MESRQPYFSHRSCYVNFAEHLQNAWNPNMFYPGAPNRWSMDDWTAFLRMLKSFSFNCFEYWLPPTLLDPAAPTGGAAHADFARIMRNVNDIAHSFGVKTRMLCIPNVIGPDWYHACPSITEDKQLMLSLWRHWAETLEGTDIVCIFPGDPGGCNRNGCDHETFIDLALELTGITKQANPSAVVEVGTWGTPFSGWGDDLWQIPNWDGSWKMLIDPSLSTPETPGCIWNGKPDRARAAVEYLLKRLPSFPEDTMVAINLGFDGDGHATHGGDAREYAREIARLRPITTWDYSVAEGELVNYPHWRLPRISARRREERSAAPYIGGMSYTMTPKLNLLSMYAAGRMFVDPDADPDAVSHDFCVEVFGENHAELGELFEAFEVVNGWGHYPRRKWSKPVLREKYARIIDHLESADASSCRLPLFPDAETYRQDVLWFARMFLEMAGDNPDRDAIKKAYWRKSLAIYDRIPMSADERADRAATDFSLILA